MVDFGERLLVLTGSAAVIAVGVVMLSSGLVGGRIGEGWSSGVLTGFALLCFSLIVAVWYESSVRKADP